MKLSNKQKNGKQYGFTHTPRFGVTPKGGGFTLVEALVAISIFTTSILALLSILAGGVADTNYAKRKIVAAYLAQEGVEYIRNLRDTFVLYDATSSQVGWSAFNAKLSNASCGAGNGCYFDDQNLDYANNSQPMTGIAITACGSSCPSLSYDTLTGKYGYSPGTSSDFIRTIKVIQVSANETKIFSTVSFPQGSGTRSMVFSESLFNWIE